MVEAASEFEEQLLVERIAELFQFDIISAALPGPDIYPPYLFVLFFMVTDFAGVQMYIHFTGGEHILLASPNVAAAPFALFLAVAGIRYMSGGYAEALTDIEVHRRVDEDELPTFERIMPWRVKVGVYLASVLVLYANILFLVGFSNINRAGGGFIELYNWLFLFEFVYLPFVVEFGLVYYGIHFLVPRRIRDADIGLFFYDPRNMGGFAELGQLLKRSYYLYTAGLLLFFILVYGPIIFSLGETPAGVFELVFFSLAWLVGVLSIGYSMYTMHQLMSNRKKQRIRELQAEMREVIENPYDINASEVTDEQRLADIRRRLDEVRGTRVYPATFTMWSQIAISVLLPQVLQLTLQAV